MLFIIISEAILVVDHINETTSFFFQLDRIPSGLLDACRLKK